MSAVAISNQLQLDSPTSGLPTTRPLRWTSKRDGVRTKPLALRTLRVCRGAARLCGGTSLFWTRH